MNTDLVSKDGVLYLKGSDKPFYETFVHEMIHGAYPHLTDGGDIHNGTPSTPSSPYLIGEFVFRSLTVSYIEKIFGIGSASHEREVLADITQRLKSGEYKEAFD